MEIFSLILTIFGLCVFEIVSSIDNAVVNADVLTTVSKKWRKWFFVWGIFFGVFFIRGIFPWLIVWLTNPALGPIGALTATFTNDPNVAAALAKSSPLLLSGGAVFLIFLFFHWLFVEPKNFGLRVERFFNRQAVWFYAVVSVALALIIWFALKKNPLMAFAAAMGASSFFITNGFKEHANHIEVEMKEKTNLSDLSKILYLEILDATFSIDGVIGAFAFTMSVPLIILGNGLGALVVRQLTIKGVDKIRRYVYLKNGAMYSIFFLGLIMLLESFGTEIPAFIAPIGTFVSIGYFFVKSRRQLSL